MKVVVFQVAVWVAVLALALYRQVVRAVALVRSARVRSLALAAASHLRVSFDKVKSHYVTVQIDFDTKGVEYVDFKVPVWTPGSYKVRDFSNASPK